MLSRFARTFAVKSPISRGLSSLAARSVETEEWIVFPRENESNNYDVNWSLSNEGLAPRGNAWRNARLPVLTMHLPEKLKGGAAELQKPAYKGEFHVVEAGDSIEHEDFGEVYQNACNALAKSKDLFVEDAMLGTTEHGSLGVRVITTNSAAAIIARSLAIPSPARCVDSLARCKGWNYDKRVPQTELVWNGSQYVSTTPTAPLRGQRPLIAMISGNNNQAAIQYLQYEDMVVGANVVIGESVPVQGWIDALGEAACVIINDDPAEACIAVPSTVVIKGNKSFVLLQANDEVVKAAVAAGGQVFGRYHHVLCGEGISSLWNGVISSAPVDNSQTFLSLPSMVAGGQAVRVLDVDNQTFPATKILVCGAAAEGGAEKLLLGLTGGKKEAVVQALLAKASVAQADAKNIASLLA